MSLGPATVGPAVEVDPSSAAFFDVDNTLMRGSSLFFLARGLYRRGFFSTRQAAAFAFAQLRFRTAGERASEIDSLRESALAFVKGRTVAELTAIGDEIYDESVADALWQETIALARAHLAAGQRVWLVTATPIEIANVVAERLGMTGALGTVAESINGVYTGRLVGGLLHGEAKAQAVVALASIQGLDLSRCSAYSDSANDIPLLSLVGFPCAVNPDRALLHHARESGWRIHDFRTARRRAKFVAPVAAGATLLAGSILRRRKAR
jgi:HAD superfamily hydrolase (TIGR01490 family)